MNKNDISIQNTFIDNCKIRVTVWPCHSSFDGLYITKNPVLYCQMIHVLKRIRGVSMQSIWKMTSEMNSKRPLDRNIEADAVVIGGGMAGILTAYMLEQKGVQTVVLEAGRVGSGQTANTTAKITLQHGLFYHSMCEESGRDKMRLYAQANREAIDEYKRIISKHGIECDLTEATSYLYTDIEEEKLEQERSAAEALGIQTEYTRLTSLPFPVKAALGYTGQAYFHPLRFLNHLADKMTVYENTMVHKVEGDTLWAGSCQVRARTIIFATHYPAANIPGFYFTRMHQERSYCIALRGTGDMRDMYYGIDPGALSFRPYGEYLILGGSGHRTGEGGGKGHYASLKEAADRYYPDRPVVTLWAAQDCMTLDHIPYIGRYSHFRPNWYVTTGFGKWGMTGSMVSAMILSDIITKGSSPYEQVFSSLRHPGLKGLPNLLQEGIHSVNGLMGNLKRKADTVLGALERGQGGIVTWQGKDYGAYRDETGREYLVPLSCPHLGCRLEWNSDEKSWDCPCHGSLFHYDGTLIDNPARRGITVRSNTAL